jgi:hypothetical protein
MPSLSELKKQATKYKIKGRSKLNKQGLIRALDIYHSSATHIPNKKSRKPTRKRKASRKKSRKVKRKASRKKSRKKSRKASRKKSRKASRKKSRKASRKKSRKASRKASRKKSRKVKRKASRKKSRKKKICKYGIDPTTGKCNKKPKTVKRKSSKILKSYTLWANIIKIKVRKKGGHVISVERNKPTTNTAIIDSKTMTAVPFSKVPEAALSAVMWSPYVDDPEDFKKDKFVKLSTCAKFCSNKGGFAVSELHDILNMDSAKNRQCPFCNEKFDMSQEKQRPPFGKLTVTVVHHNGTFFFELDFFMPGGVSKDGHKYYNRKQLAYIPYGRTQTKTTKDSLLALWLLVQAWEKGKLFTLGTSVTHGTFGIVFGGIHMKSRMDGGLSNHGYGADPVNELSMKNGVLSSLISECAAVDIFTPQQQSEFDAQ